MDSDRYQRVKAIFLEARRRSASERSSYLEIACGDDESLGREVEVMLAAAAIPRGFLELPAIDDDAFRAIADEALAWPGADEDLPERIGRYRVLRCIGEGGMGRVYEAEQDAPRRRVALKVIRTALSSRRARQRFEQEAQILGRLRHPGIAQIHEAGVADVQTPGGAPMPVPFYAMEFIDGPSLTDYARSRSLSTTGRIEVIARICDAVHHGHLHGVIHRDLKPSNILVEESADGDAQPKVIDFGVARTMDHNPELTASQTHAGQVAGTIAYMSPEQLAGSPGAVDARSDVYSLGVLTFELLTGALPYELSGKMIHEAARIVRDQEPRRLSSLSRLLRGDIETIVAKALEKEPPRRYQSASELAADLRRLLRNQPIVARPASLGYQLGRFARRHKELVGGVLAAFLLLVAGVVGTSLQWVRARSAEKDARLDALRATRANDVLQGILAFAKPGMEGGGRDVRVVEILDEASKQFAERFAEVPELEALGRRTLGETYLNLGLYDEAIVNLARALELTERTAGARSEEAFAIRERLIKANVESEFGKKWEKSPEAREAFEEARQFLGPAHRTTQLLQHTCGSQLAHATGNENPEGERILRDLVGILESLPPAERAVPLSVALTSLAGSIPYTRIGECERIQRRALAIEDAEGKGPADPEHPGLLALAFLLEAQGRLAESEPLFQAALDLELRFLGERHPKTRAVQYQLAGVLARLGKLEDALGLFRRLAAIETERDPRSPAIAYVESYLTALLDDLGRNDQCRVEASRTMDAARTLLGGDSSVAQDFWRRATMRLGLRVQQPWASEALRTQVRQMLHDALLEQPTATLELDEVHWPALRYTLAGGTGWIEGGLDDLRATADPEAGIYRLALAVDRSGSPPLTCSSWMLVCPWQLDVFVAHKCKTLELWEAAMAAEPLEKRDIPALSLAGWWGPGTGFGPRRAECNVGVVATAEVSLPPGRYRLLVTADEGLRVFVDGEPVIERWSHQHPVATESTVVEWSLAPRAIRIEYWQDGGDSRLWVRTEPLEPGR